MSIYIFRLTRRNRAASAARWMKLALLFLAMTKNKNDSEMPDQIGGKAVKKTIRRRNVEIRIRNLNGSKPC